MGLVSLTFGNNKDSFSVPPMMEVIYPKDIIKADPDVENRLEIIKVCTFFKRPEVYVVGRVVSGVVKENMSCNFNGKQFFISDVDSKLKGVGKQGMVIGFNADGVLPDELSKGSFLTFSSQ